MKNNKFSLFKVIIFGTIIFLLTVLFCLQKFYINPLHIQRINKFIKEKQYGYIVYKNGHRSYFLYISKYWDIKEIEKLSHISETTAFKKPSKSHYINYISTVTNQLYENCAIGNKIEKLANSNKCYLYKNDSIFRYNYKIIPEEVRSEMLHIEEWKSDEIGFWKVR